ncbi:hypothetical protein Lche_3256 [Legionella cherrii]|uniref:Uncharacterized protein n=1 Tax=Legionella cherrii TaxID=28084 RepID=A0A0W0S4S2_9GAMM|nr:hypothetical protein [Legionella cherrii]KTC78467.1 hypothetical protein Lche_3256 [Legionella cherrii]
MFAGILWVISFLSTLLAALYYFGSEPQNVLQQATIALMTLVYILIPFCLAHAASAIRQIDSQNKENEISKNLLIELRDFNNNVEQTSAKITSTLLLSKEINKISLIYALCFFDETICHTDDSISSRINSLKSMLEQNIITAEEFQFYKKQLLTKFEHYLKQQLESN